MEQKVIVFTDLDGTLLDYYTYSYEYSREGIKLLGEHDIPLIFCTSKSYAEVLYFRGKTGNTSPFIVENGGAVYIPGDHFKQTEQFKQFARHDGYIAVELGADYKSIRAVFEQMKKEFNNKITGFGDMSTEEVAQYLNLEPELAAMAKIRRHDEPFILKDVTLLDRVRQFSEQHGLKVYPGTRFYHLMGNTDKGVAVKALVSIYKKVYGNITTAGIGEGKNDEPMFKEVDLPCVVRKPDGTYADVSVAGIMKIDAVGPKGFTLAVKQLLKIKHSV